MLAGNGTLGMHKKYHMELYEMVGALISDVSLPRCLCDIIKSAWNTSETSFSFSLPIITMCQGKVNRQRLLRCR